MSRAVQAARRRVRARSHDNRFPKSIRRGLLTVTKGSFGPEVDIRLATTDPGNDSSFAMDHQASPTAELLTYKSKMLELEIQKY
jgi:hypothetical protein